MRIVLTGGGTGGHIVPLVTVAKKIREKVGSSDDLEFLFIGPAGEFEVEMFGEADIPIKKILVGKMRRYFSWHNFSDCLKVPIGFLQSLWYLLVFMPDAVFSKGGYASLGVVLAAWIYRIPILIHESDSVPGMTNEILGKFSTRVAVSYEEAEKYFPAAQAVLTGNPIREDIAQGDADRGRIRFSLLESKKTIFVYGGSQGAQIINDKLLYILPKLLHKYQVIHQTGRNNFDAVIHKAGELGIKADSDGYHPIAFIGPELKDILAAADLVITRAGANTLAEIAANGKPAIVVPLENSANNHQKKNAYAIAHYGGCMVLEESNLGENIFLSRIDEIMEDENLQKKLGENIKRFYHPDAVDRIADGILSMIKE